MNKIRLSYFLQHKCAYYVCIMYVIKTEEYTIKIYEILVSGTGILNRTLDSRSHNIHGTRSGCHCLLKRTQRSCKQGKL